jgi:predicted enzyme related to lactoylglutathione lyase
MCLPAVCASSRNLVRRAPSYQPENLNHMALLRKIDCVMLRVDDLGAAREFYEQVLGLTPLWSDEHSVALGMPESEAEIVLHDDPDIPRDCNVHYLVDDVIDAVARLSAKRCEVIVAPFEVRIGRCAVLIDPFGNSLNLIDMSKGPIEYNLRPKA